MEEQKPDPGWKVLLNIALLIIVPVILMLILKLFIK